MLHRNMAMIALNVVSRIGQSKQGIVLNVVTGLKRLAVINNLTLNMVVNGASNQALKWSTDFGSFQNTAPVKNSRNDS
jgi:hypothetical protein